MSDEQQRVEIEEGHGRLPWWGWLLVAACLIYAFFIAPFNWFAPHGG